MQETAIIHTLSSTKAIMNLVIKQPFVHHCKAAGRPRWALYLLIKPDCLRLWR